MLSKDFKVTKKANKKIGIVCDTCGSNAVTSFRTGTDFCPNFLRHQERKEKWNLIDLKVKDFYDSMPEI